MDNDDERNDVGKVFLWLAVAAILLLVFSGCTSTEEKQARRTAQVTMIETQVNAETQQNIAEATARTALYEAMARVAATSPDSADAIAVALAVSSVKEEAGSMNRPLVQLQPETNEAVELAKAIAPALITTVGTIGVAAIQGETNRRASDNARLIAIADSASDAAIMDSVTGMATAGIASAGMRVGGDYQVADTISQDVITTNTTTAVSENTETTTISDSYNSSSSSTSSADTNIADSYNEGSYNSETNSTSDSYNETSSSDTYNTTDTYNQQTYITEGGDSVSFTELRDLVLQGLTFNVIIDGEVVTVEPAEEGDCPDGDGLTFGGDSVVCG